MNIKELARNFSYTFVANIVSLMVSTILILIVPGFVGVTDYGYWQLYIFYASYISYMSLGLTDGAYLRYGGHTYESLNKPVFVSQYWFLVLFDTVLNFLLIFIYLNVSEDPNKSMVVIFTCVTGILVVPRSLLTFMLQATNRIKEFSVTIIIERSVYFVLVLILLFFDFKKFEYLILADVTGKICSVIYSVYICKDIVLGKIASIRSSITEIWINISVGSKLLFANLSNMLIIGIVRFSIEYNWSIEDFGKVSFTLSLSNMLLLFINAIGLVLFPALRRTNENKLPVIYSHLRTAISVLTLALLLLYFPLKTFLINWLPEYKESIIYMALLFPICLYESKMLLLINTYYKTLRKEKNLLYINLFGVLVCIFITGIIELIFHNLNLSILSITIILTIRCIMAEVFLTTFLKVRVKRDILLELCMTIFFICFTWYLNNILGFALYSFTLVVFLVIKRSEIIDLFKLYKAKLN